MSRDEKNKMKLNRALIGEMMVASQYPYIVYGSVRGLVTSGHKTLSAAVSRRACDVRDCRSVNGYSDTAVYAWSAGWERSQVQMPL